MTDKLDVEALINSIYPDASVEVPVIPPADAPADPIVPLDPAIPPADPAEVTVDPSTPPVVEVSLDGDKPAVSLELDALIASDPDFLALEVPISDKEQLIDMAKGYGNLLKEVESLKVKLSSTPAAEFKTDAAKKLATFLENYSDEEAGVVEFAEILALRPAKMTEDEALLAAFLHQNKDLSPDDARRFFNKKELSKYKAADEDDIEEQEILNIQKTRDAARAKEYLTKIKEDLKPAKVTAPTKDAGEAVFISTSSANIATLEKSLTEFSTILVEDPANTLPPIKISLTPEQQELVKRECISAVSMRSSYDDKGAFKYHLNPKEMANSAAMALFGRKINELVGAQRYKDGFAAAIKERAAIVPDRIVSGTPVETTKEPTTIGEIYESLANVKR